MTEQKSGEQLDKEKSEQCKRVPEYMLLTVSLPRKRH